MNLSAFIRILLIFFCTIWCSTSSLYANLDSLYQLISTEKDPTIKNDLKLDLAYELNYQLSDSFDLVIEEVIQTAKALENNSQLLEAYGIAGYNQISKVNLDCAKDYVAMGQALSIATQDSLGMIDFKNLEGLVEWRQGDLTKAAKDMLESLEMAQALGDSSLTSMVMNNLALIYAENRNYEKAIGIYKKSTKIDIALKDTLGTAVGFMNIASCNLDLKKPYDALVYLDLAEPLMQKANVDYLLATNHLNYCEAYIQLKDFERAQHFFYPAFEKTKKQNDVETKLYAYITAAHLYTEMKDFEQGSRYSHKALKLAKEMGIPYYDQKLYSYLSKNYVEKGFYKEALKWQKKSTAVNDSLFSIAKNKQIQEITADFYIKEKDAENELLKLESHHLKEKEKHKTRINLALIFGLFLLGGFLIQSVVLRRRQKLINQNLEKIVAARTADLQNSNKDLLQSNEELKRFAYITSHDLKEPLRNIGSFVSLIKRRLKNGQVDELPEYIDYAQNSTIQMTQLVEDILEYSKIISQKDIAFHEVDLNQILSRIKELLANDLKTRNAIIQYDDLPTINFNSALSMMVIKNLIENGLKYNKANFPQIRITHELYEGENIICISDNGIGIDSAYRDKIFDMFSRLHDRESFAGSGMGLALCRKIIRSHGGDIWVESKINKGSKFYISFPESERQPKRKIEQPMEAQLN